MSLSNFFKVLIVASCCLWLPAFAQGMEAIQPCPPDALLFGDVVVAPINPLVELLSLPAKRDLLTGEVTLHLGAHSVSCRPGSLTAVVDGHPIALPLAPSEHAQVLYSPLRPIVQALGGEMIIDVAQHTVKIALPGKPPLSLPLSLPPASLTGYLDDQNALYLANMDGSALKRLTYNNANNMLPSFSPDGQSFVWAVNAVPLESPIKYGDNHKPSNEVPFGSSTHFTCHDNALYLRRFDTPTPRLIIHGDDQHIYRNPHFGHDGHSLFCECGKLQVNTDELADCHTLQMKLDGSDVRDLGAMEDAEFSADGLWMAYTQQTATGRIIGLRQQAGMETRLLGAGTRPFFSPDSKQLFFYRNYSISNDGKAVEMLVRYIIRGNDAGHLYEPKPEERVVSERDAHFTRDGKHLLLIRYTKNYLKNNIGGLAPVTPLPTVGLFLASPDLAQQQLIYRTNKDEELESCQQQGNNYLVHAWQSKYFILSAPNYNLPTPIYWLYNINCRLTPDGNQILLTKKPE